MSTKVKKEVKVPANSLCLSEPLEISLAEEKNEDGEKKRTASMLAYSGGVIKDHWWWGDLVIDTEGMKFQNNPLPILEDHMTDKKIGMAKTGGAVQDDHSIRFNEIVLLSNEHATEFYNNSKDGFPYQASVRVEPAVIEHLEEKGKADVNGMTIKGPATIFRQVLCKESSVCVFGADGSTASSAFSEEGSKDIMLSIEEIGSPNTDNSKPSATNVAKQKQEGNMNKEELLAAHPELAKMFEEEADEAKVKAEQEFNDQLSDRDAQIATLTEENTKLSETNAANNTRIDSLERNDTIRSEKEMKFTADSIVEVALKSSNIPARLHPKVTKSLDYGEFVENNVLDTVKFTEKVTAEVAEWNSTFKEMQPIPDPAILGMSQAGGDGDILATENKSIVERMLGYNGMGGEK